MSLSVSFKVNVPEPVAARALSARRSVAARVRAMQGSMGFPLRAPTWPGGVERPPVERTLGADFDTGWARETPARVTRALVLDAVVKPAVDFVASPTVTGLDRLEGLEGPAIFFSNHASHLDTLLLLTSLPVRFRHRTVVAAAADYFFDRRVKAIGSALALAAIPIDRTTVSRRSLHLAEDLLDDGWNLVIFPEGGRTADGWAQEFKGGAAYLATRGSVPVVPVHIEGSRRVWRKGGTLHRSQTVLTFGRPIVPGGSLGDARRLAVAMERAVSVLADEQATDWWRARRRAAEGTTPPLRGPAAGAWRRSWALEERARTTSSPRWPH
jgi:1-acyl-sn-glycerol-3-phosphate acyltransferase